ncbi:putative F-box/kelch-repeat protein [Cardamine amara subsp. amara]|uniref:F-box/kelch-repeat protein n=1 Tax=Cardamine amara subsp. amara TaxID=228776 RepID=A0ABD1CB36_CARAN
MLRTSAVYSMSLDLSGIHNNIDSSMEVKGELVLLDYYNFEILYCNGLLLCINSTKTLEYGAKVVVHNPFMGNTRWIELRTVYKVSDTFALGYENNKSCCTSYKILRFACPCSVSTDQFEIYEFNSKSWKGS